MSHLAKVVLGSLVIGAVLGLIVFGMTVGLEQVFVDADGHMRRGRRSGPLLVPVLLGAAAGWVAMKGLEKISGISGAVLIFILSLVGAAAAFGVAVGLASGQLERMSTQQSMFIAGLSAVVFVGTATWMAYMDE
jgi:hypothetical protein